MDYICLKESTHCEFYDSGKCHNVENCAYAIAGKPSAFNYADYVKMQTDLQKKNEYTEALRKDRDQWKIAADASRDVIQPMLRKRIEELESENVELRAERDALAKSISIVSEPIETIQPRGIVE